VVGVGGISIGCSPPKSDRFCPDDFVTRDQMAAFFVRVLSLTDRLNDPATVVFRSPEGGGPGRSCSRIRRRNRTTGPFV